jgi:hypothetical protein
MLCVLATLLASPADAFVAEIWTRTSLQFTNFGRAEASATATGLATLSTSSTTSSHLLTATLSSLTLDAAVPVTDPNAAPITLVIFSLRQRPDLQGGGVIGNISGAIASPAVGLTPNTIPVTGGVTLCLLVQFPNCLAHLNIPLGATTAGMNVGGGVGGIVTIGGTGSIRISVLGAPYTVKTVSAVNRTTNGGFALFVEQGFAHGPLSLTSSTAQTSGVLQIVTASHITIVAPGDNDLSGNISRTLIHVIPEPGLLLLVGSGAAGLALLGRSRAQGSRGLR